MGRCPLAPLGVLILRHWRRTICRGTGENAPFVNRTFEWGVVIATVLSVLSVVPRHCARLTCFVHPKLRKNSAALITLKQIILALRRLPRAVSTPFALHAHRHY